MKANELMIGDWVAFRGRPYQYTAQDIATIAECEEKGIPTDTTPIPLTSDILEKNGFRETDMVVVGTRKMRWESEDGRTEITIWMDCTMSMEIRKNIYYEDEECYTLPFAWAVHKLQQALRLCEIEKEIVL